MAHFIRLLAYLALLTPLAGGQDVVIYCDCGQGDGPCGNGVTTDVPGGCLNSIGAKAFLFPNGGSTSVADDDLILVAGGIPLQQVAVIYMGAGQSRLPFADGLRCVAAGGVGLFRFPARSAGDAGHVVLGPGIVAHTHASNPAAGQIQAGDTWNFQCWYRDPAGPCGTGSNLTSALQVTFEP